MEVGQCLPRIILPAIDGSEFDSKSLKGKKYLITFFRFATCPLCKLRVAQLAKLKAELVGNCEVVTIFESEIEHLKKHANKQIAIFPILADYNRQYYELFGVKKSLLGLFRGIPFRLPTVMKAMLSGYFPQEISSRFFSMPLSLLVDEQGIIRSIYNGKDAGDHMPLEQIIKFAKKGAGD